MFYARINKIKFFNNREGFLGLFNRAELRIYSHVAGYSIGAVPSVPSVPPLTLADLFDLYDSIGNIQLDYTLFGFDKSVNSGSESI
ncbi:MAG: hypothetical protein LBS42_07730 [Tannerella sp.]|jgi:hypothetical protein|nr:hypothetical protein [Tannerella sp.]